MRVALVAAEAVPFVKVGGLADVVGSLAAAVAQRGWDVSIYVPWYRGVSAVPAGRVSFAFEGRSEDAVLGAVGRNGVRFVFIGLPDFDRESPYGYHDDVRRFVRFNLAAAAALSVAPILTMPAGAAAPDHPTIIHAHDWQTALMSVLARAGRLPGKTIYTIHNLAHQGRCGTSDFYNWTQLPRAEFHHAEGLEYFGEVNLMKGGITYADAVTTVSPTYTREIRTPEGGCGLDGVLRKHEQKLSGILNGIDTHYWDPERDGLLADHFAAPEDAGKERCRAALATALGLQRPVLGVVSRLAWQKGLDFLLGALPAIFEIGYSVAVLGSGEQWLEEAWRAAAHQHVGRVAYRRGYDEPLAHLIYAGSDAFLMPSRFEPCGLAQMISQRYATPPIARAVGGLVDTVEDGRTGLLFNNADAAGISAAVRRFHELADPAAMAREGMRRDFSWNVPAGEYEALYKRLGG